MFLLSLCLIDIVNTSKTSHVSKCLTLSEFVLFICNKTFVLENKKLNSFTPAHTSNQMTQDKEVFFKVCLSINKKFLVIVNTAL